MTPRLAASTLFPYTTLFRSLEFVFLAVVIDRFSRKAIGWVLERTLKASVAVAALQQAIARRQPPPRSEEHTSELQSPYDLVCRLLLEKKKLSPSIRIRSSAM